jgi:zinc transporter ZupT
MLIYLFLSLISLTIFYFVARFVVKIFGNHPLVLNIFTVIISVFFIILSFQPVYTDMAHNPGEKKDIISLYSDQYTFWAKEREIRERIKANKMNRNPRLQNK